MSGLLKPRAHVFRGHVDARGFLFDLSLIGETEARRRVLALWSPRAAIFQVDEGWAMLLPEAKHVRADQAPGAPLVELENELVSAPLEKDERGTQAGRDEAIIVVRGGRGWVTELDRASLIDPAEWIDVSDYVVAETKTLGELPPVVPLVTMKVELDLTAELGGKVSTRAAEVDEVLEKLSGNELGLASAVEPRAKLSARILARLAGLGARLLSFAKTAPAAPKKSGAGATSRAPGLVRVAPPVSSSPGFFERLRQRLENFAAKITRIDAFGALVGRMHAGYLARMMEMFEQGNLDEALRHAIPLHDDKNPAATPGPSTLRMPVPRSALNISSGVAPTSALGLRDDLFSLLQQMYRRAFDKLERAGRIEEAAFVLAELLKSSEEAVAFLEKHGRLELAAKLAESRDLSPGLVVRQWFLAGDIQRAVMIAKKTHAFADAIHRLSSKKEHRRAADELRRLWAESLAAAGNYGAAVDTLWPVVDKRHLAAPWVEAAINAGGPAGARMLVRSLILAPDTFEQVRGAAIALLEDSSFEGAPTRTELARALIDQERTPGARVLARSAVRATVRDEALWNISLENAELRSLTALAADDVLRTDLPPRQAQNRLTKLEELEHPRYFRFRADDCGAVRIADVARLPSGRLLVALGELGVRYLTPDGRTIAAFDQPAESLVVSDHGDRAITVASRGDFSQIGRIDLAHLRATPWCHLNLTAWAHSFDGSTWYVAELRPGGATDTLLALDATSPKVEASWRLGDVRVAHLARTTTTLSAIIDQDDLSLEVWSYELPSYALRRRKELPEMSPELLLADGTAVGVVLSTGTVVIAGDTLRTKLELGESGGREAIELYGDRLALALRSEHGVSVLLLDARTHREHARLELDGARTARVHLDASTLIAADDRGRVVVLDTRYGRILRILRVS